MFNIKRLNQLEQLLLESNLIKFGDQFVSINQDYRKASKDEMQEIWDRLDLLIDMMVDERIIDLENDLQRAIGEKEFGSEYGATLIKQYLSYCKNQIAELSRRLNEELSKPDRNLEKLQNLAIRRIKVATRVEALEIIYKAFKVINNPESQRRADEVLTNIDNLKNDITKNYEASVKQIGIVIQEPLNDIKKNGISPEDKRDAAYTILDNINVLNILLPFYTQDAQESAKKATAHIEQTVESQIGKKEFEEAKRSILRNERELAILRRILGLKYMHFVSEDEIHREIDRIQISINGLEGSYHGMIISSPEVIKYLKKILAEEADAILTRAREKSITLDNIKGIHYGFNTKLPLHQATILPVTGKQLADASHIMKFRKRMQSIINLIPSGKTTMTLAGQAWSNFGKNTHAAYAKILNKAGKVIGKMANGREGELKGDAFTRLLIPDTSVIDNTISAQKSSQLNEDGTPGMSGSSPGSAYQVPGSIGSAGPIEAPTANSFGSGDKFQPGIPKKKTKLKKKQKKYNLYEDRLSLMDFNTFSK